MAERQAAFHREWDLLLLSGTSGKSRKKLYLMQMFPGDNVGNNQTRANHACYDLEKKKHKVGYCCRMTSSAGVGQDISPASVYTHKIKNLHQS